MQSAPVGPWANISADQLRGTVKGAGPVSSLDGIDQAFRWQQWIIAWWAMAPPARAMHAATKRRGR